jgi:hypothetical protein
MAIETAELWSALELDPREKPFFPDSLREEDLGEKLKKSPSNSRPFSS